ncbi:hypothetical protein [Bosea sp. 124]|uniref:hypothetical protein n=1 Tax=Bosea sp. 124 TaxID=2135642 RepID=UPI000D4F5824|nr:hypothetical protein [Bosea sp. 124]PTM41497.1 hypothetical protein C8D03_3042 [Bosea sp. 124]
MTNAYMARIARNSAQDCLDRRQRGVGLSAILIILFVVTLHFAVGYATSRDPWSDESMLLWNILKPELDFSKPLPFYDQAAPVGYMWIARALLPDSGVLEQVRWLRFVSVAAILIGIVAIIYGISKTYSLAYTLAITAIILSSPLIWAYSTEIKQYGLEFSASTLVLLSGWRLVERDDWLSHLGFFACSIIAGFAAYTAPIIVCAVLAGVFSQRLIHLIRRDVSPHNSSAYPGPLSARFIIAGTMSVLAIVTIYFLINKQLLTYIMSGYAYIFDRGKFDFDQSFGYNVKIIIRLIAILLDPIGFRYIEPAIRAATPLKSVAYASSALIGAGLIVAMVILAARAGTFFVLTFIAVFGISIVLNLLGLIAFDQARFFLFIAPVTLIVAAIALVEGWRFLASFLSRRLRLIAASALAALFLSVIFAGAYRQAKWQNQELSPLLAHIATHAPTVPLWVYCGAQPAASLLSSPTVRLVGMLDRTSSPEAWPIRGGCMEKASIDEPVYKVNPGYIDDLRRDSTGERAIWLIFSHDFYDDNRSAYLSAVESSVGPCRISAEAIGATLYFCGRNTP